MSYYLKNTWYVATWADEVGRQPLRRKLLDQDLAIFRKQDGQPVAIGNRCPHRFAPLSMGKLIGDCIECPYHGLQFDGSGNCVVNPHGNKAIPPKAQEKVRVVLTIPNSEMPPAIRTMSEEPDIRGNFILEANWQIPSIVTNHIQFLQASGDAVFRSFGTHILTPETEHPAHYFYGLTRRHLLDDPSVDSQPDVYAHNYVLVRTDQHVAWRGDALPENANDFVSACGGRPHA